jgi:hypothetical protein
MLPIREPPAACSSSAAANRPVVTPTNAAGSPVTGDARLLIIMAGRTSNGRGRHLPP